MENIIAGDQNDNHLYGWYDDDILRGLGGDDTLFGADGNDVLEGGAGNDVLDGGQGNNIYLFGRGDGQDLIQSWNRLETKHNMIQFGEDIAPSDIIVERIGERLELRILGSTDSISVDYYFMRNWQADGAVSPHGIEEIRFFDGTSWSRETILNLLSPMVELDDQDNHSFDTSADGKGGNDFLVGSWRDDVLRGGDGNDTLIALEGDDIIDGGAGDDLIDSGEGNNTIVFSRGGGHDTLQQSASWGSANVIKLTDALPGTVAFARSPDGHGSDLVISYRDTADTMTVKGFFDGGDLLRLQFADRSILSSSQIRDEVMMSFPGITQVGSEVPETIGGTWGNDLLSGGGGDDSLHGYEGNDTLKGEDGNDQLMGDFGNDMLDGGAGDDRLDGGMGNDVLTGGEGRDDLFGGDGDDILDAGAGAAHINGGGGNNMILFGRSSGEYWVMPPMQGALNTIVLAADVRPDDVKLLNYGNDWELTIVIKNTMAMIKLPLMSDWQNGSNEPTESYTQLKFADGTVWDNAALLRMRYTGQEGADFINGTEGNNWMDGRGGDDHLHGMGGNDSLRGGAGNDFLVGGQGNDVLLGQAGDDHVLGDDGDDFLNGGAGADRMMGGEGTNIYQIDANGGLDTVDAWTWGTANTVLQFGAGIDPENILVRLDRYSGELVVVINEGMDQVTVLGQAGTNGLPDTLSEMRFANGVTWTADDILRASTSGNNEDNHLYGSVGNDIMDGKGGNDFLHGMEGDDILLGGAGDDRLFGGMGNNSFEGGTGNDQLEGYTGADTYIFNVGDGNDTISEFTFGWGGEYQNEPNTIRFGAGITPADLRFEMGSNTMVIFYGAQDSILIPYSSLDGPLDVLPVDRFEFADNSVWTYRQLTNHAPELMAPIGEVYATEGKPLQFDIPAHTFFDRDIDTLRYELELADGGPMPSWLQFDAATGNISGTPGFADSGELLFKLTAIDKVGASASDVFRLKVENTDQAPQVQHPVAAQHATEAVMFSVTLPSDTFVDPEGGWLSVELTVGGAPLPAWLHFDAATLTMSGMPGDADTGVMALRLTAKDAAGNAAFIDYTLDIANVNQAPVLLQVAANQSVEDGVAFNYVLPADMFGDADAGDSGVLSIEGLPSWLSYDAHSRSLSGTAALANVGPLALTVVFTDAGGLSASTGFVLDVTAAASMNLVGGALADTLTGKSNSDVLVGLGGDDILNGGIGADRMEGGNGNDTMVVDHAGDSVIELAAQGTDTVMASISYTLAANVERLTLAGNSAINATGNSLNNLLTGNSGANVIDGGLGDDNMVGGAGNDTYMVGSTSDIVVEAIGGGFDRVVSAVSRTLGENQEVLTLTGGALNGYGNALANLIQGNGANNTLTGGDGGDILQGGLGADTLNDTSLKGNLFDGGAGADRLTGGAGNDMFIGGAGIDTINTSSGADIIAFNRGDGQDSVAVASGTDNTVSLGKGIVYTDLALSKSGNDLILKVGLGETISFKGWYSSTNAHSVGTLQVVTAGGADYVAGSASAIHDNKVEQFNFTALTNKFDQVRVGQSSTFTWNMASSLETFSNGGSDTAAIGGDLAYQYGLNGNLAALSGQVALGIVGSNGFGTGSQGLQGASELNDGFAVLY